MWNVVHIRTQNNLAVLRKDRHLSIIICSFSRPSFKRRHGNLASFQSDAIKLLATTAITCLVPFTALLYGKNFTLRSITHLLPYINNGCCGKYFWVVRSYGNCIKLWDVISVFRCTVSFIVTFNTYITRTPNRSKYE